MRRATCLLLGMALALIPSTNTALGQSDAEAPQAPSADPEPEIVIRITGLRSDDGRLLCALYVEESWLSSNAVAAAAGEIEQGVGVCRFRDVEPGTYAISTFHDENGNGELDSGFMRIPKEGTAASNNAYRKFGPPRYRDANFDYDGGRLELEAETRYIGGGKKAK